NTKYKAQISDTTLIKLTTLTRLIWANSSRLDFSDKIVFAFYWCPSDSPQHRNLSHVSQRISNWTLKQFFGRTVKLAVGGPIIVKRLQSGQEPCLLFFPRLRRRVIPCLVSLFYLYRPVKHITDM